MLEIKGERVARHCVCCNSNDLRRSPAVLMPFIAHRVFDWAPVRIDSSWGLNTIENGNAYSICNTLFCTNCKFLFLDIRFSDDEMKNLYQGYRGEEYVSLREHYEPGYRARNEKLKDGIKYTEQIEKFLKPHLSRVERVLDWGGDTGKNTPFKGKGVACDIYDISDWPVVDGATRVTKQEISDNYDLVVCSNVLEHVSFPSELLGSIRSAMNSDTILYLELPHEEVVRMAPKGSDWNQKKRHWHEHINFFHADSLRALLGNCGFDVIELKEVEILEPQGPIFLFQVACKLRC